MKKALSLLLAVVMVMSLVACGGNNTANNTGKEETGKTETPGSDFGDKSQGVVIGGDKTEDKNSEVKAEYASEITLAGWGSIATLDPGEAWNASREAYQRLVYDTLLYHDDTTGEITMQLAKSVEWDNDDCTRVHVVLRDDIVFSNGEKLTAADVEFSIGRNTYSSVTSFYDNCEIVNDYELYINLKKPCSGFMPILSRACCAVVCKSEAEKHPDGLALIGSGPYVYDMDSFVAGNSITLVRNDKFWGEKNPTEKIKLVHIADPSAAAVALKNGEINFFQNFNDVDLVGLKATDDIEIAEYTSTNFVYMGWNDRRDSTSLTEEEKNFRRAVACAINKEDIVAGLGGGAVMTSLWPFDHPAHIANESDYEHDLSYNPEKAKEYLAAAGGKTEFTCWVTTDRAWCKLAAQVAQEYLKQVGITMNIEETDGTGFSAMSKWDRDVNEIECHIFSNLFVMESVNWNYYTVGSGVNRPLLADPEATAALEAAQATADADKKNEYYQTMQRENHENVTWLPLVWRKMNFGYTKGLQNFEATASPTWQMRGICLRTN